MSKEKVEKQEKQEVKVFKGRPRPVTERRKGAKKLDLKKSAELFEEQFYIYWPESGFDTSDYEDDDGNIDIDLVPVENLMEFTGRYIDPGSFLEIVNTPLAYDLPEDKQLNEQEVEKVVRSAIEERLNNPKTDADIRYEVIQACIIDPQFESVEQIKKVLPVGLQVVLYEEITKGAIGENLVARFQGSN